LQIDKSLFPPELWSTLEGQEGEAVRKTINKGMKKKAEMLSHSTKGKEATYNLTPEDKTQKMMEKIKSVVEADDVDAEVERDEDEEDAQEEENDYDYAEDEADMGGDYAAEQYFDGGEGDEDDGDAGGGDDF
jgi:DNA-directed RNA polymerase III subunit RPC7